MDLTNSFIFTVDFVDFDWDSDDEVTQEDKDTANNLVIGKTFGVMREDDVCDFISDVTGWCVDSMSYHPGI